MPAIPLIASARNPLKVSSASAGNMLKDVYKRQAHEDVFTGLFALVQIFIAMQPDETVYFANPGPDGKFNKDFYFHWADANNEPCLLYTSRCV